MVMRAPVVRPAQLATTTTFDISEIMNLMLPLMMLMMVMGMLMPMMRSMSQAMTSPY